MKKILLLAVLLGLTLPGMARAVDYVDRWDYMDVKVRVNANGVVADSTTRQWTSSAKADTTVGILTQDLRPNPYRSSIAALDTSLAMILYAIPEPSVAATVDTLYILSQVSDDGTTWVTCTQTGGNPETQGSGSGFLGSAVGAQAVLEQGSTNCIHVPYDSRNTNGAMDFGSLNTSATAPSDELWAAFKYIRFIISGVGHVGQMKYTLGHWKRQQ